MQNVNAMVSVTSRTMTS